MRSTASSFYPVKAESNLLSRCVSWSLRFTPDRSAECTVLPSARRPLFHLPLWDFANKGKYPTELMSSAICLWLGVMQSQDLTYQRRRQSSSSTLEKHFNYHYPSQKCCPWVCFPVKRKHFCWPVVLVSGKTKKLDRKGLTSQADLSYSYDKGSPGNFYKLRTFNNILDGIL